MTLQQADVSAETQIGSVRARLARIAWVGVLVVVIVVGLLGYFAVRYVTTVDTMRAWVEEDGTVLAEIPEDRAGRVAVGQDARVRIAGEWYEGQVESVGANPVAVESDDAPDQGYRYVQLRVALADAADVPPAGARAEVRVVVGWP